MSTTGNEKKTIADFNIDLCEKTLTWKIFRNWSIETFFAKRDPTNFKVAYITSFMLKKLVELEYMHKHVTILSVCKHEEESL